MSPFFPDRPAIVGFYTPHLRVVVFTALALPHFKMEKPRGREGAAPSRRKLPGRMLGRKFPTYRKLPWELLPALPRVHMERLGESGQAKKETSIEFNESYFIFPEHRSFQGAAFHIHTWKSLEFSLQVSKTLVSSIYLEDKQ